MALGASTVFQIQTTATASNVNGGGFNFANANMATDLACDAATGNTSSPIVSSASYNFTATDVGHWLYVQAGSNWTVGWYQIASVSSNKATLSAAVGQAIQVALNRYGTNTVAGVGTVATPTSGTWAIDYSQADASPFTAADLASTIGTTNPSTVTSATNPFTVAMVGNLIHVNSGSNWTAGWNEIVSVSGSTATLDAAVGSAASLSSGTYHVGGALSLGSSDDAVFELAVATSTAGARYFVKSGTYTIGGTVTIAATANANWPIIIEGYATTRGDRPTGSTRPVFNVGANSFTNGNTWNLFSMQAIGTAGNILIAGNNYMLVNSKVTNTSTTTNRAAATTTGGALLFACEFISYRGLGLNLNLTTTQIINCYIHNCVTGFSSSVTSFSFDSCIFESCITSSGSTTSASGDTTILNTTFYGSEAKMGTGILATSSSSSLRVLDSIFYGFTTGVSNDTAGTGGFDNYNDFFNNTNDVNAAANWQKGPQDVAINPTFTSANQVTGTAGKFSAANNILIDTTKNFASLGVIAGRDFVYISAGTGVTNSTMWAGITSITTTTNPNDTLNLDIAQGTNTTTDKVYTIPFAHNFLPRKISLFSTGYPGVFPGALTTGYTTPGAVQIRQGTSGSSGSFTFAG